VVNGYGALTDCYDPDKDWLGPSAAFGPNGKPQIASVYIGVGSGAKVLYTTKIGGWTTRPSGTAHMKARARPTRPTSI